MPTILKLGGSSLENGDSLRTSINIIKSYYERYVDAPDDVPLVVVVSARGEATAQLRKLVEKAARGDEYEESLDRFVMSQYVSSAPLECFFNELRKLLRGVYLLKECTPRVKDAILSIGECLATAVVVHLLEGDGLPAVYVDGGDCLVTDSHYSAAHVDIERSRSMSQRLFSSFTHRVLPVVTGFIARDEHGNRTTLGPNAGSYTAALLANFLDAEKVCNYTTTGGVYTADPLVVKGARKIDELSYSEAAELSQFGARVVHGLAMEPLQKKNIPFHILNIFTDGTADEAQHGTCVTSVPNERSVRALASMGGKALIHFEGRDMLGCPGIDARIFSVFGRYAISVSLVSQGSSERGIALVVDDRDSERAVRLLKEEFSNEMQDGAISNIYAEGNLAVVALIGVNLSHFDRPYKVLVKNSIIPVLLNNAVPGNTVCLLLKENEVSKALNVIHSELFEPVKKVHVAVIGHGKVGRAFIEQILSQRELLLRRKRIDLRLFAVADSKRVLLDEEGLGTDWEDRLESLAYRKDGVSGIIEFAKHHHLENLVAIDNTASDKIPLEYECLAEAGFDLVSSNKISNTKSYDSYQKLRRTLIRNRRTYRYETNVGAGLPLIDNIRLLHLSGDRITRISGLFSGSLSFIFNQLSNKTGSQRSFKEVLRESVEANYTEPDPRIDLCGLDVARKVLILARELDIPCELEDVQVQSLVPDSLSKLSLEEFKHHIDELGSYVEKLSQCGDHEVVRFVGELIVGEEGDAPRLSATLRAVPISSALANSSGADSCFEIYTENYGDLPIVIQGAGAGAVVTAQGVFADLLRIIESVDD